MTAQLHERLIYEGEATSMASVPALPQYHPRVVEVDWVEARAAETANVVFSTACWRHYQGNWEIRDGELYLVRLRGVFRLVGDEPLHATWVTDTLRIPRGEVLKYVHMGFETAYAEELHVQVERGRVVATRLIDNRNHPEANMYLHPAEPPDATSGRASS